MKRGMLIGTILLCLGMAVPVYASGDWVLYDNFNTGSLDPTKWTAVETGNGRETARKIVTRNTNQKLNMLERGYGNTSSNSGSSSAVTRVNFTDPSAIRAIQARVTLVEIESIKCTTNTAATLVGTQLSGRLFNIGPQTPGDQTNDVLSGIYIQRKSDSTDDNGTVRVAAGINICTNSTCSSSSWTFWWDFGTLKEGESAVVSMEWDKANSKLIFQCDNTTKEVPYDSTSVPHTYTPTVVDKRLQAFTYVPNCTSSPRPTGFINVLFDNVKIKETE